MYTVGADGHVSRQFHWTWLFLQFMIHIIDAELATCFPRSAVPGREICNVTVATSLNKFSAGRLVSGGSLHTESAVLGFVVLLVRTFHRGPEHRLTYFSVGIKYV